MELDADLDLDSGYAYVCGAETLPVILQIRYTLH